MALIPAAFCSVDVLLKGRNPQGTIAWVLLLILFPLITIPAYLCFGGRKYRGYKQARVNNSDELSYLKTILKENTLSFEHETENNYLKTIEKLAKLKFLTGNSIKLLIDGNNKFKELYECISSAKNYILVQYYTIRHDEVGSEFQQALLSKIKEGVKVIILYDSIGSYNLSNKYIKTLRDCGAEIQPFGKYRFFTNKFQVNFRNHRKLVIIDGKTALCGGLNVGNEYLGKDEVLSPWRDTHLKICGPGALQLQLAFVEDWYSVKKEVPDFLSWEACSSGEQSTLASPTGPADQHDVCIQSFTTICNMAQKRIWITSPYFVPPTEIAAALVNAVLRGVDVKIILPENSDTFLAKYTSETFIDDLNRSGIEFWKYKEGFMHQKVVLIDSELAVIGSTNIDNRSFMLNFELSVFSNDKKIISQTEEMLESDLERCKKVPDSDFINQNTVHKITSRFCRLLAPLQ